jgi:ATP-dependent Clp protease ATP-binding subunit ClpA
MYERFTDRSRHVMQVAHQEAQRFGHEYVGTEHILFALITEPAGIAANVLKNLDVDLRTVRSELKRILPGSPKGEVRTTGELPTTPWSKKVVDCAVAEARRLNHNYVGTEHLLLGLIVAEEGVAAQVLEHVGLNADRVRHGAQVLKHVGLNADRVRHEVMNLLGHLPDAADAPAQILAPQSPEVFAVELPAEVRDLVADLGRRIETARAERDQAVSAQIFDWAAAARDRAAHLTRTRDAILREWRSQPPTA